MLQNNSFIGSGWVVEHVSAIAAFVVSKPYCSREKSNSNISLVVM